MASVFFKLRIDPAASAVSLPATAESIEDLPIGLANLFKPGDLLAQARPIPEGAASFLKNATEYHAGVGTRFDARTGSVVADAYGIARLGADGCSLTLKRPVVTNADASRAWLLVGQGADGTYPGLDLIYSTLVECGFNRPFPPEQLGPQLTAITTGQAWLAVAAGTAPIDGSTEWHELLVDPESHSSGEGVGGRIDYRERRRFVTVKVGQPLVRIHPERPCGAGRGTAEHGASKCTRNALDVWNDPFAEQACLDPFAHMTKCAILDQINVCCGGISRCVSADGGGRGRCRLESMREHRGGIWRMAARDVTQRVRSPR